MRPGEARRGPARPSEAARPPPPPPTTCSEWTNNGAHFGRLNVIRRRGGGRQRRTRSIVVVVVVVSCILIQTRAAKAGEFGIQRHLFAPPDFVPTLFGSWRSTWWPRLGAQSPESCQTTNGRQDDKCKQLSCLPGCLAKK